MVFKNPPFEVAIIGGGIGGLALGQLLQAVPDVKVTVYEKNDSTFDRVSGYRVMIMPETLEALRCNLRHDIWQAILPSLGMQPRSGQEQVFLRADGSVVQRWTPAEARDCLSVSRWKLREGLLKDSDKYLKLGKGFEKYEKLPSGRVKVHFTDGSNITCDMLIGADGVGSRVRAQLLPNSIHKQVNIAVIYFKIPLTPETLKLLPQKGASTASKTSLERRLMTQILCPNNQNIYLHLWQNPRQPWAIDFDLHNISADDSFIMMGFGSPVSAFINKSNPPSKLSSIELKAECIERARRLGAHADLISLAELGVVNSAHLQTVRKCKDVTVWDDPSITLLGDSVLSIPTTLGKGANCALLDAVSLADMLSYFSAMSSAPSAFTWRSALHTYAVENLERRETERRRSAFMQNLIYFGRNPLAATCRDLGFKMALRWVEKPGDYGQWRRDSREMGDLESVDSSSLSDGEKFDIHYYSSW